MNQIITLLIFCSILLPGCVRQNSHYKFLGQLAYRRTYTGLINVSEAEQDSVIKSNPEYMVQTDSSSKNVLAILNKLGISNKEELFLDKIALNLKDAITIADNNAIDSVCIIYDTAYTRAAIQIKNEQSIDNIPIKDAPFSHTFKLVKLKNNTEPYLVFVNQYYIMNGDNYEVSVYKK